MTGLATRTRIRLRRAREADLPAIEAWYDEAASAVNPAAAETPSLRSRYNEAKGGLLVIERDVEEGRIGLLDYRFGRPEEGWVTVEFLALAAGHRGWGYGTEAVRLLEAETQAERYTASVHRRNGLGLYFWLRLGYRPAHAEEAFWRGPDEHDTIAMLREVASSQ